MNSFSLTRQSKKKKTIYRARPKEPGIQDIFDWSEVAGKYIRREVGNKYYAIKKQDGRQISRCFQSFEEARAWRRATKEIGSPPSDSLLLKEITHRFIEHKKSQLQPSTIRTYLNQSQKLESISAFRMTSITDRVVDEWLQTLRQSAPLQKSTRISFEKELGLLQQICGFYQEYLNAEYKSPIRSRHRRDSVVSATKRAERIASARQRFLTETQRQCFLSELAARPDVVDRLVYGAGLVQIFGGLRIGEACALRWQDVDLSRRQITVSRTVVWSRSRADSTYISEITKTGEPRDVPLIDVVIGCLGELRIENRYDTGLIFSTDGIKPLSYRAVQYRYDKAFKRAGLGFRSTHILRHSFATDFLTKTSDQPALQGILGHATQKQTAHYAKINSELKKRAMERFNDKLNRELHQSCVAPLGISGKVEAGQIRTDSTSRIYSEKN